ncbi:MAG: hypothetical protein AAF805_11605 [Planctomycetota bacterium]
MIDRAKLDPELHEWAAEMTRIGGDGVRRAQEEARRQGVPCVYSINGVLHWELPDGSLTTEDPWDGKNTPPQSPGSDSPGPASPGASSADGPGA